MGDAAEHLNNYDVRFETAIGAWPNGEPSEYVIDISGNIMFEGDGPEHRRVGNVHAQLVQVGRARNDRYPVDDVFDVSQELDDVYAALFDPETAEMKESIRDQFEVMGSDILILSSIEIDAEHRGHGLGLAVISRCIDVWEPSDGLVVCKPFPLQFDSSRRDDVAWKQRLGTEAFVKDQQAATTKLATYWQRLGMKPIVGTKYAAMSMTLRRPSLEAALQPKRTATTAKRGQTATRGRARTART